MPFAEPSSTTLWRELHAKEYHGTYEAILERNRRSYHRHDRRLCQFSFDPSGKTIIDLGCGGGWHMLDCIASGANIVYGVEIDQGIIDAAERSFRELGVPEEKYRFLCAATADLAYDLPEADVIYSIAMFMHIPWQEIRAYISLIAHKLKGTAYLQFYQEHGCTTVSDIAGRKPEYMRDVDLDCFLESCGLRIADKEYPREPDMLPVWTYYSIVKGTA